MYRIGFAVLAMTLAILPVRAVMLEAVTSSPVVSLGDPFTIDINISGLGDSLAPSLALFDIQIAYESAFFTPTAVSFGNNFSSAAPLRQCDSISSPLLCPATFVYPGFNFVRFTEVSIDPLLDISQPDAFTLATLTFDATGVGSGLIAPNNAATLTNTLSDPLRIRRVDGDFIDVQPAAKVIPEPSTVVLVLGGILMLGLRRLLSPPGLRGLRHTIYMTT